MVGDRAVVHNGADDFCVALYFFNLQTDQTVIQQDGISRLNILRQVLIGNGCALCGTHDLFGGQSELLACL